MSRGFFDICRRDRGLRQQEKLRAMEEVFRDGKKPAEATSNLCLRCEKYNVACPYGMDTDCIGCSDFLAKGSRVVKPGGRLCCVRCGSTDVVGTYGDRYKCRACGNVSS